MNIKIPLTLILAYGERVTFTLEKRTVRFSGTMERGPHVTDVVTTGKIPGNLLDATVSVGLAWTHRRRKLSEPVFSRSTQEN